MDDSLCYPNVKSVHRPDHIRAFRFGDGGRQALLFPAPFIASIMLRAPERIDRSFHSYLLHFHLGQ